MIRSSEREHSVDSSIYFGPPTKTSIFGSVVPRNLGHRWGRVILDPPLRINRFREIYENIETRLNLFLVKDVNRYQLVFHLV